MTPRQVARAGACPWGIAAVREDGSGGSGGGQDRALDALRPAPRAARRTVVAAAGAAVAAAVAPRRIEADDDPHVPIDVALLTHAGGAHLPAYLGALAASAAVARVRVSDPDGAIAVEARRILGAKLVAVERDPQAALAAGAPCLALVSMEAALAPAVIRTALDHGCHVLAEKPACTSAEDFRALSTLAEARGRHLLLAFANRLNPEVVEARARIAAGAIGRPVAIEMHLVQDRTRLERQAYRESWFADRTRAGGGHLAWLGIHWLDLAMHLVGAPVVEVAAFTANLGGQPVRIEDSAVATLVFAGGALGTLASGYWLDAGYQTHCRVWGTKGWLEIDSGDETVLRVRSDGGPAGGEIVRTPPPGDAYGTFVHAVADAIARGAPPPLSSVDARRAVETVFAAYRSDARRSSVRVG